MASSTLTLRSVSSMVRSHRASPAPASDSIHVLPTGRYHPCGQHPSAAPMLHITPLTPCLKKAVERKNAEPCCTTVDSRSDRLVDAARDAPDRLDIRSHEERQRTPKTGLWTAMPAPCHSPVLIQPAPAKLGVGKTQSEL